MLEKSVSVESFLSALSEEDKHQLFNDLLAVAEVYQQNKNRSFYALRKARIQRHPVECRKRTLQYRNQHNDELVITQTHEQHLFKNCYHFKVYFNFEERDFHFVEELLDTLRQEHTQHYHHPLYA
ncbi:hypothetical protein [Enterococcus asini]|uniref:hypothetical protein n=1 Tax=Enterococcus asini TaxID=57732 RepID=UPI002891F839|nr:hypothetical protein [Enterococcus asini]MDT2742992.1 hypothetical protein [Enterococcus asini]